MSVCLISWEWLLALALQRHTYPGLLSGWQWQGPGQLRRGRSWAGSDGGCCTCSPFKWVPGTDDVLVTYALLSYFWPVTLWASYIIVIFPFWDVAYIYGAGVLCFTAAFPSMVLWWYIHALIDYTVGFVSALWGDSCKKKAFYQKWKH